MSFFSTYNESSDSSLIRDLPFTLHKNSPVRVRSYNIKISLRLQQFSGDGVRPDDVYYDKKPKKPERDSKTVGVVVGSKRTPAMNPRPRLHRSGKALQTSLFLFSPLASQTLLWQSKEESASFANF